MAGVTVHTRLCDKNKVRGCLQNPNFLFCFWNEHCKEGGGPT